MIFNVSSIFCRKETGSGLAKIIEFMDYEALLLPYIDQGTVSGIGKGFDTYLKRNVV